MVDKLTANINQFSLEYCLVLCNPIGTLKARIQQFIDDMAWYFNVALGCTAAACAVALLMPITFVATERKTTGTAFSILLTSLIYLFSPVIIIGALIYFVCQANSKLSTLEALQQSQQDIKRIHDEHQDQIEKINSAHQIAMKETRNEMSDVLKQFTEHAQEIYKQLTLQNADFKKMGAAQEALQQLIRERVGSPLGGTLDQMNKVVAALGQITQLPKNLNTIAIQLKEAQTRYDTLNKRTRSCSIGLKRA